MAKYYLVAVNDQPHSVVALRYACIKAAETGAHVRMLYVIDPMDYKTVVPGMGSMKENLKAEADAFLQEKKRKVASILPADAIEHVIREGVVAKEIIAEIQADPAIKTLILGVSGKGGSKGKLLPTLSQEIGESFTIPLTIVPGNLTKSELEALH